MRKTPLLAALGALALILAACASSNSSGNGFTGNGNSNSGSSFRTSSTRTLSPEAKLALGTIKLEGTPQAVDAKTAAKLLPLWQLMVQLHSSSSTAPQEITAVSDAIQAAMTTMQLTTIGAMSFTQADIFSVFQSQAQASGSGSSGSGSNGFTGRNSRQGGREFFFAGGPGGGFGGPAGAFGGGEVRSANGNGSSSTASAVDPAQAAQARENAISTLLENQLIRLLQAKLGRQPG